MKRMRAPAFLIAATASACRSRSSMITVRSLISESLRCAIRRERLIERPVEVQEVGNVGAARDLLHVDARARVEHAAAFGKRDD